MDKKLVDAYNEQIKNELYSAYLYLAMAAYFESENLGGFAHWMKMQAKEETEHAMKMFEFLCDRGERVVLKAIDEPTEDFESPVKVFEETLKHEKKGNPWQSTTSKSCLKRWGINFKAKNIASLMDRRPLTYNGIGAPMECKFIPSKSIWCFSSSANHHPHEYQCTSCPRITSLRANSKILFSPPPFTQG